MGWKYDLVRTRDGARVASLEPVSHGSWGRRLDQKSGGSHDFKVTSQDAGMVWASNRPDRRTLVVSWEDESTGVSSPVYAGLIKSPSYDVKNKIITAPHEDIWGLLEDRQASPRYRAWDNPNLTVRGSTIRYADRTRRTLIKKAVQLGMTGIDPDAPAYDLPISFPADEVGNWSRTFRTSDWLSVTDYISALTERGGPMQVDFPVEWSAGSLRWRLQVTHALQHPTTVLHVDVPRSPVTALSLSHDVSEYASEYHVVGSGEGADVLHNYWSSSYLSSDQVARVKVETDGSIDDFDELTTWRDGLVQRHTNATVQFDATVAIGDGETGINPAALVLGQSVLIRASDDPILPMGDTETMLIGFSPSGPRSLNLELSPVDGFTGHSVEDPSLYYRNLRTGNFKQQVTERIRRTERRVTGGGLTAATTTQEVS